MSNLLIDIGNTFSKIAVFENNEMIYESKVEIIEINFIKDLIKKYKIKNTAISNVGSPNDELFSVCKEKSNLYSFTEEIKMPITNPYNHGLVGDDRLALVLSAYSDYPDDNVLIVDMGTCITYDIKTNQNLYQAGGISPGLELRLKSLSSGTFKLDKITPKYPNLLIAHDTESSISIGVLKGIQNEIEGFIENYKTEYNNLKVIISGGDSNFLYGKIKNTIFTNSNFIYKGLNFLIEHNQVNE